MAISTRRLERISLCNYIKYEVLPKEFVETLTEPLIWNASVEGYITNPTLTMEPLPTSLGRGWVPFDDSIVGTDTIVDLTAEQTNKVSVVGPSTYTIDYVRGIIKNPDTVPTSVTYQWNYVSVVQGWPGEVPPPLPVVAIQIERSDPSGFQLGGGVRRQRQVSIHIFATSNDERDDITDLLEDNLFNRHVSIRDYSTGDYIKYDGTFNTGFSPDLVATSPMTILDPSSRIISLTEVDSDLNRYRSVVNFLYETYDG